MLASKLTDNFAVITFLVFTALTSGCQLQDKPSFHHNVPPLEKAMIEFINTNGSGERYVINKVNVSEEVVDWFTISLTTGNPYSALSASGSGRVGAGSVVQFCGWGEFLGVPIFTEYPYLCKRGEGLVFGVTKLGWVHLYGTGEIAGKRISLKKPG